MNLYLIGDEVFYPISDHYLLYICKKEVMDKLNELERLKLIKSSLESVMSVSSATVH